MRMPLIIAAILSGTDPVGKLPPAAFHRWLEDPVVCPKCDARYNLVCDFDEATGRFFERDALPLLQLLRKAIFMGHLEGHPVTHYETSGVVVRSFALPRAPTALVQ